MKHEIIVGDTVDVLPSLAEASFDAALCDPPYHLTQKSGGEKGFMKQKWDGGDVAFRKETWSDVMRLLKPGSCLMAFGGTRTFHRLVCAIEDAGMDIRDTLVWLYADSRPPNLDISKAIDKAKGAERKVVGRYKPPQMKSDWGLKNAKDERTVKTFASSRNNLNVTAPATPEAIMWSGYGTALKPSCELVSLSMKPMEGDFVENALNVGVSGLNIDATRIPVSEGEKLNGGAGGMLSHVRDGKPYGETNGYEPSPLGRWPKNVIFDEGASEMIGKSFPGVERFFYCNKVSTRERNAGMPEGKYNDHPTLKPISLVQYFASLLLPPPHLDGSPRRILVPFAGAMSEVIGCLLAGWDKVVAVENNEDYVCNGKARIQFWLSHSKSIFD